MVPCALPIGILGTKYDKECLPKVMMRVGLMSSICLLRYGEHLFISFGEGSLLLGGRHLTIFVINTSSLDKLIELSNFVSNYQTEIQDDINTNKG